MKKINTNNGSLYYNEALKSFYIKSDNEMILFKDKRVINSSYVAKQIRGELIK